MNMYTKIFPKLQNTMFQPNNQLSNFKWLNQLKGIPYLKVVNNSLEVILDDFPQISP